ncbi:MAG: hypothetical protein ACI9B8_003860 [Sulfitobacter sp.]|jgi:hypothetical protein
MIDTLDFDDDLDVSSDDPGSDESSDSYDVSSDELGSDDSSDSYDVSSDEPGSDESSDSYEVGTKLQRHDVRRKIEEMIERRRLREEFSEFKF